MEKIDIRKQNRNSSIELLRIIAMVMIVFHHFCVHGGFEYDCESINIPRLWYNFISMGGKIGVNIFILISGYFLIEDKGYSLNWKRLARFWGQVFFYSTTITLFCQFLGIGSVGISRIARAFFPIIFRYKWFASTYFVLYLMHPFLNKFLRNLNRKEHQVLLICLLICWCIIPTLTTRDFEGNNFLWFVCLYCVAAYIRVYGLNPKYESKHYFVMWIILSLLTYCTSLIFSVLSMIDDRFTPYISYFYGQEMLTVFLISISLYMAFTTLRMSYSKWINMIASTTFGIYLIHDHDILRTYLWQDFFKNASYQDSIIIIPYSIAVVIIVFLLCYALDLIRQATIEKIFMIFVEKYLDSIIKIIQVKSVRLKCIVFGEDK